MTLSITSLKKLKHFFALFIICTFIFNKANAQLVIGTAVQNQAQAEDLVKKVLIGKGVTVSNIQWKGFYYTDGTGGQLTSFSTGNTQTNLGIKKGVMLSTGNIYDAPGPNDVKNKTTEWYTIKGIQNSDVNLETIIGYPEGTYDAAVIEFDFVPSSSPVKFRYVFASEEYPEYVCSRFNDVFAFFLTGPKPSSGNYTNTNLAIIPGSNPVLPVAINTVNPGEPGINPKTGLPFPAKDCQSLAYSQYYVNNTSGSTIQFDGFTKVMVAQADVIPCMKYHIKIAIADMGDSQLDSGVFLEEGSFSSEDIIAVEYTKPQIDSVAVKECNDAIIKFSIAQATNIETKINFVVQSTASRGTDFTLTPNNDFVTIPAGSTTGSITLHANASGPATYNVNFTVKACDVTTSEFSVKVISHPELKATPSDPIAVCGGQPKDISVVGSGGLGNKTYQWSSNPAGFSSGVSNPTVSPTVTTTYTCTVSDACGTVTASVIVTVIPLPVLIPAGPLAFCPGDTAMLKANTYEGYQYQWTKDGINIEGETNSSFIADTSGTYNVIVSVGEECINTSNSINITMKELPDTTKYKVFSVIKPADEITNSNRSIKGTSPFDVSFYYSGNDDEIVWDFGDNNTDTKDTVNHSFKYDATKASNGQTIYHVTLTIGTGNCARTIKFDIIVQSAVLEKIPDIITPDKSNCNSHFHITGTGIGKVEVTIFDRWGVMVHEKTYDFTSEKGSNLCPAQGQDGGLSYYSIWDGNNKNGGKVSAGVYFYVIKPFGIDGSELEPKEGKLKGSITLIR